jgi:hypothetical protein
MPSPFDLSFDIVSMAAFSLGQCKSPAHVHTRVIIKRARTCTRECAHYRALAVPCKGYAASKCKRGRTRCQECRVAQEPMAHCNHNPSQPNTLSGSPPAET